MKRRDFIRNAVVMAALVSSGSALAEVEGQGSGPKIGGDLLRLQNREEPTAMEQKHVPGIEVPEGIKKGEWFDVVVRVGFMKEHPSVPEHWIEWIKLLVDGQQVAKTKYKYGGVSWSHAALKP
jgi:superoxide reductase